MNEWKSIETAPLDGTEVLVVVVFGDDIAPIYAVACSTGGIWRDCGDQGFGGLADIEPTHWMPLPPAPHS
jgi:hypothetical protein